MNLVISIFSLVCFKNFKQDCVCVKMGSLLIALNVLMEVLFQHDVNSIYLQEKDIVTTLEVDIDWWKRMLRTQKFSQPSASLLPARTPFI